MRKDRVFTIVMVSGGLIVAGLSLVMCRHGIEGGNPLLFLSIFIAGWPWLLSAHNPGFKP